MLAEAAVEHVHFVWLGFDLTLPALPANSSDHSDTEDNWAPLLGEMVPPQFETSTDSPNPSGDHVLERAVTLVTPRYVVSSAPPDVLRMCDTARRERSGVLRI